MLADRDRIFTNLYGMRDRSLAGARSRGHWDGTAALLQLGRQRIIDEVKASGLRGPRRGRFSNRPEMVVHAQKQRRATGLSRGERR